MPRYKTKCRSFNNDHKLAGFDPWSWYLWRKFLKEHGLIPHSR